MKTLTLIQKKIVYVVLLAYLFPQSKKEKKEKSEVEFNKLILNSALKYFFGIALKNEQAVFIVVEREYQSIQTFLKTIYFSSLLRILFNYCNTQCM